MEDLEGGWEVLPDDGFLEIHDDGGKMIFSRKFGAGNNVFKNYFMCPSPKSSQFVESTEHSRVPKQLVPLPIELEPPIHRIPDHEKPKEITKVPIQITIIPSSAIAEKLRCPNNGDQDPVSQVFFKKMKENEFVDMKMDSPKSSTRGIKHQIDAGNFQFEDKSEADDQALESRISSPRLKRENMAVESDVQKEVIWEENSCGLNNIWNWSFTGIGAICSFGVAAATVCIIIFAGGRQKNSKHYHQENHKVQFHIYAADHDKRLNQVVHHATKLNEAISAVRGVPLARAHITVGGNYDGL